MKDRVISGNRMSWERRAEREDKESEAGHRAEERGEMPSNQRRVDSHGITLTTLMSPVYAILLPLHSLPTSSFSDSLHFSTSLSFAVKKKMVRTKQRSEDLDIKPFSQDFKPQEMRGTGRGEKWTGEDRRALFMYVERHGAGNWTAAAASVPGKTAKQIRSHASDYCGVLRLTR